MLKRIMIKRIIIKKSKCYNRYLLIQYGLIANPEERKITEKVLPPSHLVVDFMLFLQRFGTKNPMFQKIF